MIMDMKTGKLILYFFNLIIHVPEFSTSAMAQQNKLVLFLPRFIL